MLASEALVPFTDSKTMTVNSPIKIKGQDKVKPHCAPMSASTARRCCAKRTIPMPRSARRAEGVIA
jgi:hypothetical protein